MSRRSVKDEEIDLLADTNRWQADEIERLTSALAAAEKLTQQLWDKQTCMCGGLVEGHGIGSGHSPVPMYDYALQQAEERAREAEARVAGLRKALEKIAARDVAWPEINMPDYAGMAVVTARKALAAIQSDGEDDA